MADRKVAGVSVRRPASSLPSVRAAPLTLRELFRVLHLKFAPRPLRPREVLARLKTWLPYANWSERRLRRLMERSLTDPRARTLLSVTITPPVNETLSAQLCHVLAGLREAIVIPSIPDERARTHYLGVAAANAFAPRFRSGQGIGLSDGQALYAFVAALRLSPDEVNDLRLYALTRYPPEVFGFTAEGLVGELIARHLWHPLAKDRFPQNPFAGGFLDPTAITPDELDFAFLQVGTLDAGEVLADWAEAVGFDVAAAKRAKVVAELLGHLFCADGLPLSVPLRPLRLQAVPLRLLRAMVQAGKTVVLMAGGERGAKAISALYRAQRAGGSLFNTLVTDEDGARALLRQMGDEPDRSDEPNGWQRERLRFWAAHFYFASSPHHLSRQQLAQRLSVSRERASELLDEAIYGRDAKASLVRLQVVAPLPEPMPMLELEMALLQKFALREARVVEAGRAEWAYPAVGMAAAQLLLDWLQQMEHFALGLGGGRALRAFMEALNLPHALARLPRLRQLELWALYRRPFQQSHWGSGINDILDAVAMRCHQFGITQRVRCRPFEGEATAMRLDALFTAIGHFDERDRQMLQEAGVNPDDLKGVVGTLLSQPFDAKGQPIGERINEQIGVLSLKAVRRLVASGVPVVGLVAIPQRARPTVVAYQNGLVNCLVVERRVAEAMLAESDG